LPVPEKEYIIFCDESDKVGRYYSNFYGGLIVGASQAQPVTGRLNAAKQRLNLFGEVKWAKVTQRYLEKYAELVNVFFDEVAQGNVKVRIMFRQNARKPVGLTQRQIDSAYFLLYYQFIKHAFGLDLIPPQAEGTGLRLYFDQFPDTREQVDQFKGFLHALGKSTGFQRAAVHIRPEDITEVSSHDHALLQCLDIVLGAMTFRLNDKHKEKPPGTHRRGKRTRDKESLYKVILGRIRQLKPNFNIGISTGGGPLSRWEAPYQHWAFVSQASEYDQMMTKQKGIRRRQ